MAHKENDGEWDPSTGENGTVHLMDRLWKRSIEGGRPKAGQRQQQEEQRQCVRHETVLFAFGKHSSHRPGLTPSHGAQIGPTQGPSSQADKFCI